MSLTKLTGTKQSLPINRTNIMNSWFSAPCSIYIPVPAPSARPVVSRAPWASAASETKAPRINEKVETESTESDLFKIATALRHLTEFTAGEAPMPPPPPLRACSDSTSAPPASPYARIDAILNKESYSSKILEQKGLLRGFRQAAVMELSLSPSGFLCASIKSARGYRRSLVSRPDGYISERIIDPAGKEVMRLAYDRNSLDRPLCISAPESWTSVSETDLAS